MTITLGWWVIPLIISLIGTLLVWRDSLNSPSGGFMDFTPIFYLLGYVTFWGIPWGIYGVCRAIFG